METIYRYSKSEEYQKNILLGYYKIIKTDFDA